MRIKKLLPEWMKGPVRSILYYPDTLIVPYFPFFYMGKRRYCPVCERSSRKFGKFGRPLRKEARCIWCGSLERHRLTWLYFKRMTDLFDERPKRMLHVAPEPAFEIRLKHDVGHGYITADLLDYRALSKMVTTHIACPMVSMDITQIACPDESFDVIYASHVLEHVQKDVKAMCEFYRVLKNNGWAVFSVPITAEKTFEDASIIDPAERLRLFGQEDHVRRYGPDFMDRLRDVGFTVKIIAKSHFLEEDEIQRMKLTHIHTGEIYYCTKPRNASPN